MMKKKDPINKKDILSQDERREHYTDEKQDREILDILQEGDNIILSNRRDDQERLIRLPLLLKESKKLMEVGKSDARLIELLNKKVNQSGRMKGLHKRKPSRKKELRYRTSEDVLSNILDSQDLSNLVGEEFALNSKMKKSYLISVRLKHIGMKAGSDEVISVRVIGTLENESGRAVAYGPLRGVLPVQQVCLASLLNKQDFLESLVGSDRIVKVVKPAGYDEPYIVSHREVHPSLLCSSVVKAYKNSKEFKEMNRYFDQESLKKFLMVLGTSEDAIKNKKRRTDQPTELDLIVYSQDSRRESDAYHKDNEKGDLHTLFDNLLDLTELRDEENLHRLKRYLLDYVFINENKIKKMEQVGVRAYEYRDDLNEQEM